MKTVKSLLTSPDNWLWGEFHNASQQKIRYGWNAPTEAKELLVLMEGRSEAIEEYFETIRDLNAMGYACAIMDWQGQGLSYRYFDDNSRQHSEGFEVDITDFHTFLQVLARDTPLSAMPKIILAHSMGGNIALRYLADYPDHGIKGAYLVAPMLGLHPKHIIKYTAKPILSAMTRLGWLDRHAFAQGKWTETYANIAKYKVSGDPVRRELQPYLFKTRPELRCGGVTFGWLAEALRSVEKLHDPIYCARIQTPVHMAIAGKDVVVNNEGSYATAALLPNCQTELFDGAEHQIHREQDKIREKFLASLKKFMINFP